MKSELPTIRSVRNGIDGLFSGYKDSEYPTEEQKVLFAKTLGCCRFVYNWAPNLKIDAYRQEKKSVAYKEVQDRIGMGSSQAT